MIAHDLYLGIGSALILVFGINKSKLFDPNRGAKLTAPVMRKSISTLTVATVIAALGAAMVAPAEAARGRRPATTIIMNSGTPLLSQP